MREHHPTGLRRRPPYLLAAGVIAMALSATGVVLTESAHGAPGSSSAHDRSPVVHVPAVTWAAP
jgi:hypothetical protein